MGLNVKPVLGAALLLFAIAVNAGAGAHKPGGPYFFGSFATDFKEPMTLIGEMNEIEAKKHAATPASVYTAWFNDRGALQKVEKNYLGKRLMLKTYDYDNGTLVKVKTIDEQGKEHVWSP